MEFAIEVGGRVRHVAVNRVGSSFTVSVDGKPWDVDPTLIDPQTLSLLIGHRSYEVTLAPDQASGQLLVHVGSTAIAVTQNGRRRWGRSADGGSGPQRIMAPMPGKVVRVLVKAGEAVQARQPLIVVEAMKMENELRAARAGTVAEMHAREGASVDAGALLAVITEQKP
jgi:biotin carboxyl carrier protein